LWALCHELVRSTAQRFVAQNGAGLPFPEISLREAMSDAVFDGFLRPGSAFALPDRYAMFSEEGDRLVKRALTEFLPAANHSAAEAGLSTFHERLSALQDGDVRSAGGSYFDDCLGWADPEDYDASGALKPRHDA
jgi:hypothetical protein